MENSQCNQTPLTLTCDNSALSNIRISLKKKSLDKTKLDFIKMRANNCTGSSVAFYMGNSASRSTLKAIASDIAHFKNWGGQIPASPETVARYVAEHASSLAVSTLKRRLSSISQTHLDHGIPSPTANQTVRRTMQGISRVHGTARRQAAPLSVNDVASVVSDIEDQPTGHRDRALILLGFAGAFRREELCGLERSCLEFTQSGVLVTISKSKTDQYAEGQTIQIPRSGKATCPVSALERWLDVSGITTGPVFRGIDRHGNLSIKPLSGNSVATIIKKRADSVGLDAIHISGHSLRAGYATSAARAGQSRWAIQQQTRHKSTQTVDNYVRLAQSSPILI